MSKSNFSAAPLGQRNNGEIGCGHQKGSSSLIRYGIFVIFGLFYVIVTILRPSFLSLGNLYDIFTEMSIISFVSFGEAIVIAAGGLDLSVGNMAGAAAMLACHLMSNLGYDVGTSVAAGVAIATLIGVGNGLMVTRLHMNSSDCNPRNHVCLVRVSLRPDRRGKRPYRAG